MQSPNNLGNSPTYELLDARRHRRFKLQVAIRVYPRGCPVVRGDTVDISESGISAMLREEVPLAEMVRLEFILPLGEVELLAMVRQRNAFRYGFQFVEATSAHDIIGRTCRQLAVEQSASESTSH
ncbi:MAG TPA: PilZ domain-containing protein [Candidatus Sulfotelmatobacter sp.]